MKWGRQKGGQEDPRVEQRAAAVWSHLLPRQSSRPTGEAPDGGGSPGSPGALEPLQPHHIPGQHPMSHGVPRFRTRVLWLLAQHTRPSL